MRSFARKYTNILNDRHPQCSSGHPVAASLFGGHKTMLKETVAFVSLGSAYESVLD
jgi:hypothetical protein